MFEHLTSKNYSEAEMKEAEINRRRKRKLNEISNTEGATKAEPVKTVDTEFKEPETMSAQKKKTSIKECAFNPFGNDECDMCGA